MRSLINTLELARRRPPYVHYRHATKLGVTAPNILDRRFNPIQPNTLWAGDITYIKVKDSWLYLAGVMDLFSRRIVGWACSRTADTDLSIKALKLAVALRRPMPELLFHSDQGCQYISPDTTNHNAIGLRPANECANVPPSTNSNSPPNGTPWAIREAIRPLLLSNWAM